MAFYNEDLIEEIRSSNDIVDVISQYVSLKRSGRNFFGLCPFHNEKSPSFSVSPEKQIFHCFGCNAGGNVIHFVSKIENVDFKESLEILAQRVGITLPQNSYSVDNKKQKLKEKVYEINKETALFYHNRLYLPISKAGQEYVKRRKLDNNTLKMFSIGYSGNFDELYKYLKSKNYSDEEILASSLVNKNEKGYYIDRFRKRLMFPIHDVRDRVIGFGGRILDNSLPKYINSPENVVYNKGRNLFALNVAKKYDIKRIIVVEGYMDTISLYQRGITNVVASLGTSLTESQGRLLRKYSDEIIISYDSDTAGQAATLRGLEILQNLGCNVKILQMQDAKDPDEYVIKYGSARFNKLVDEAISLVEFQVKLLKSTLDLNNTSDKIKFLNKMASVLAKVDNAIEQEIYINNIALEYKISKEAIQGQINKIKNKNNLGSKILEKPQIVIKQNKQNTNSQQIDEVIIKKERVIIYLLSENSNNLINILQNYIIPNDFKLDIHKEILEKLYDEVKKGNSNISSILNLFEDQEKINYISGIITSEYEILDKEKALMDTIVSINREKLMKRRNDIIEQLDNSTSFSKEEISELENELSKIIIELAKK